MNIIFIGVESNWAIIYVAEELKGSQDCYIAKLAEDFNAAKLPERDIQSMKMHIGSAFRTQLWFTSI